MPPVLAKRKARITGFEEFLPNPADAERVHPGFPTCAKCGRPVDRLTTYPDHRRGSMGEFVLIAQCHGEKEVVRLPISSVDKILASGGHFWLAGEAFGAKPPELPAPARLLNGGIKGK